MWGFVCLFWQSFSTMANWQPFCMCFLKVFYIKSHNSVTLVTCYNMREIALLCIIHFRRVHVCDASMRSEKRISEDILVCKLQRLQWVTHTVVTPLCFRNVSYIFVCKKLNCVMGIFVVFILFAGIQLVWSHDLTTCLTLYQFKF